MRVERFAAVTLRLQQTLARCAVDTDVDAIHDARTGSRRLDALLDVLERESAGSEARHESVTKLHKLLRKVRRGAGKARDMDVLRGQLQELVPEDGEVPVEIRREVVELDAKFRRQREKAAEKFQHNAEAWRGRLKRQTAAVLRAAGESSGLPMTQVVTALDDFAELCREFPVLDAGTLHVFRKGAKHARYMVEAGDDDSSRRTAKRLKQIQDAAGLWHDWLLLAVDARNAADGPQSELVRRVEAERDRYFHSAIKTAERVRKQLLAEWEAQLHGRKKVQRAGSEVRREKIA